MIKCDVNRMVGRIGEEKVQEIARQTFKFLKKDKITISVAIVDNNTIKKFNKNYRGKNKPTDVLSFGERDSKKDFINPKKEEYLGEIIISYPEVQKQAKEDKKNNIYIFKKLLVHGILHLLGYEHEGGGQKEKKMFKLQEEILNKIK